MPGTQAHATPPPEPRPYTGPTEPTRPTECYAGHAARNTGTNAATNTGTTGNDALATETDAGVTHRPAGPAPAPAPAHRATASPPADCLQCGEPTEYPVEQPGIVLCPVCEWQEAQRSACSG
ncbi:hypothetical protein ACH4UR_24125 [Streptomyces lydicus]|uniref:hypothetical protein n=1 Tax=Streptomyces lydicus TaxID=47763 RepID=UPI00379A13F4